MPRKPKDLNGSFYRRGGRWWWDVRLPGEGKHKSRPLIPDGSDCATTDEEVAYDVARQMLQRAAMRQTVALSTDIGTVKWDRTVAGLVGLYRQYASTYYRKLGKETMHVCAVRHATNPLLTDYALTPADEFGPLALKAVRTEWEKEHLCRSTVNARVRIIQQMFKWAVSEQLVPAHVYAAVNTVEAIKQGRSVHGAREPRKVRPVDVEIVRRTQAALSPVVSDMVELQLLTGMRGCEVRWMQPRFIDRSNKDVWWYNVPPEANKNAHREGEEYDRTVPLIGKAQAILSPYLLRNADEFCFKPAESCAKACERRRANRKTPLCPSHIARYEREKAQRQPRQFDVMFDKDSYRQAIDKAVTKINNNSLKAIKKKMEKATAEEITAEYAKVKLPAWHPHQLRHTAATIVRSMSDLDAARALLGQKSLAVAEIYAEVDRRKAVLAAQHITA